MQGENVACNVSDSTIFALNQAELDGGGMHVSDVDSLSVRNVMFAGNEAASGGGAAMTIVVSHETGKDFACVTKTLFLVTGEFYDGTDARGDLGLQIRIQSSNARPSWRRHRWNDWIGNGGNDRQLYLQGERFWSRPRWSPLPLQWTIDISRQLHLRTEQRSQRRRRLRPGSLSLHTPCAITRSLQEDVRLEVQNSRFHNNTAEEGGALHTAGDVDLTLTESRLTNNEARTDGGAIKALNYQTSESERSFIVVHNCTVENNQAGSNLFEDALYGTETVGGGFLLIGNGIDLEVKDSNFTNNKASHGGAIKIEAVAECNIADKNM